MLNALRGTGKSVVRIYEYEHALYLLSFAGFQHGRIVIIQRDLDEFCETNQIYHSILVRWSDL